MATYTVSELGHLGQLSCSLKDLLRRIAILRETERAMSGTAHKGTHEHIRIQHASPHPGCPQLGS